MSWPLTLKLFHCYFRTVILLLIGIIMWICNIQDSWYPTPVKRLINPKGVITHSLRTALINSDKTDCLLCEWQITIPSSTLFPNTDSKHKCGLIGYWRWPSNVLEESDDCLKQTKKTYCTRVKCNLGEDSLLLKQGNEQKQCVIPLVTTFLFCFLCYLWHNFWF